MSWLPAPKKPGEKVMLKISYVWDDPQFADIENIRQRTPFRKVNRTMLEALRLGSTLLVDIAAGKATMQPTAVAAVAAPPQQPESKPVLSKTANNLLDTYGG